MNRPAEAAQGERLSWSRPSLYLETRIKVMLGENSGQQGHIFCILIISLGDSLLFTAYQESSLKHDLFQASNKKIA